MVENICSYDGLCNMQHPITDVNSEYCFQKSCLIGICNKEQDYLKSISKSSPPVPISLLEKNVKSE